ncbi:DUF6644 family protein [Streptomyces sp. JB150]|uniref:DUF6644 family protein n=1 Tax=Streptomyces sp. JB150 TaxID=2714844 RepID=UPI0014089DC7|nr:DUF6644 family protein [Streptomyces sp. JB150]QIJ62453.1 hypothetical protein G7Z13_10695 [Streptomyces sp. JB150]
MNDFFSRLEGSVLAEAVRTTPFLYASLEIVHILGIALLVGPAVAFDLRLLGIGRDLLPVTVAARHLLPPARFGLLLALVSGSLMFVSGAATVSSSAAALWKLGLLLVAALNVAVFHTTTYRTVHRWDTTTPPPRAAKAAATVSLLTWTAVVAAGRLLAYT